MCNYQALQLAQTINDAQVMGIVRVAGWLAACDEPNPNV
jgi:hypothetical protein